VARPVTNTQTQILPVFNELKNPTIGRANMMIISTTVCVMVIYVAVAICGYFTYGDNVSSNILNDYPTTSIPATVARLGMRMSTREAYYFRPNY
jgi:amino acid permease